MRVTADTFRSEHDRSKGVRQERVRVWWQQWSDAGCPDKWPGFKTWWKSSASIPRREHEAVWNDVRKT